MTRLLLVEDDADVRLLWEHVLLDAEYRVDVAETIEGAHALMLRRQYDLVIADGRLSDGTGTLIADYAKLKGIPSLIITAYAFNLREAGIDLARYDVLLKPVRPSELLETVGRILRSQDEPPA